MLLPFGQKSKRPASERLPRVMRALDMLINEERTLNKSRDRDLDEDYDYIQDAARWAKVLAARRKMDPDLAATAAVLQNIGRIVTGMHDGHAEAGYEPAKRLLVGLGCFQSGEIEEIASAVRSHSVRDVARRPLDELVKDVDVYVRYLQGYQFTESIDLVRLNGIKLELQTKPR
jgi:uncharacterized protein